MFSLQYKKFAEIRAFHNYYKDLQCPDVYFDPARATLAWSRDYNLIFANRPGSITVIGKTENVDGSIKTDPEIKEPICLQFFLKTSGNALGNITALEGIKKLYMSNLFPNFTLGEKIVRADFVSAADACPAVYPNIFMLKVEAGKYKAIVIKRYWPGGYVKTREIKLTIEQEILIVQGLPDGRYQIEKQKNAPSAPELEEIYVSSEAADSNNWLAIVEIFLTRSDLENSNSHPSFSFTFNRKAQAWTYFLVDIEKQGKDFESDEVLNIEYSPKSGSRLPAGIKFEEKEDAALSPREQEKKEVLRQNPTFKVKKVYVFKSQNPIPFLQGDFPTISLLKNGISEAIIKELPAPAFGSPDASIIVNI